MSVELLTGTCRFCNRPLYLVGKNWYDESDGDSCWGDKDGNNKDECHQPLDSEHPADCPWYEDWHACNCGALDRE